MDKNFFYTNLPASKASEEVEVIKQYSNDIEKQFYVIDKPLMKKNEEYSFNDAFIILTAGHKAIFLNYAGEQSKEFEYYVEDILEDIGIISDTYAYKSHLGRPREWKEKFTFSHTISDKLNKNELDQLLHENVITEVKEKRNMDLIISLFTGSINDIERIGRNVPNDDLEIIKQKIIQFDTTQTNFIYSDLHKAEIIIQGLSGTGKTELLLHKLKELYISDNNIKMVFTCHNKILADKLKKRIPEFFDFMKVDEQIKWDDKLWCFHAWGSRYKSDSGLYSFITRKYGINYYSYSEVRSFDYACMNALDELSDLEDFEPFFDYILIDESQDFTQSFFDLCKKVTKNKVFIAGDIFQNVFQEVMDDELQPDYLLNKCYRTDPKTLMFAHGLSMGLFEEEPIRWLEDKDWEKCGYSVYSYGEDNDKTYELSRVPISRFEDIETNENILMKTYKDENIAESIVEIIRSISVKFPTVIPDDIAIVFLTNNSKNFELVERLHKILYKNFEWNTNNAYESKITIENTVTISNKNNVKGLEFPFVICISRGKIIKNRSIRNSLYMLLTRSFLQSYFLIEENDNEELIEILNANLSIINEEKKLRVKRPLNYLELQKGIYGDEEQKLTLDQKFDKAFKYNNITNYDHKMRYRKSIMGFYTAEQLTFDRILEFIDSIPIDFE